MTNFVRDSIFLQLLKITALFLIVGGGYALAQSDYSKDKSKLRNIIEKNLSGEIDTAVRALRQRAKNGTTEKHLSLAIAGMKQMFYNKAYNQYRCILKSESFEEANECSLDANGKMVALSNLIRDHFTTLAPRSANCEMKSRLYEAELEFPPFDNISDAQLFDFTRVKECLLQ